MPRLRNLLVWVLCGTGLIVLVLLATFAMPVRTWRTGELPASPLPVIDGGPPVALSERVWVDTDAACGEGRRTDPDDCLALLLLARSGQSEIAGISTVFGNAPLEDTDRVARALAEELRSAGLGEVPVFQGSADALDLGGTAKPKPAHSALRHALEEGPLTVIALGPLTNIAAALHERPDLQRRVVRLVAVMGRRPGHVFHPAEGADSGILFGHGPVFRDLNVDMDREAARAVLSMRVPTTLVPYEVARTVSLTAGDMERIDLSGGSASWVAERSRGWLDFWRSEVGRNGFYPFDLLAAQYVLAPELFDCAPARARMGDDDRLWNLWFHDPMAMLVAPRDQVRDLGAMDAEVVYCPSSDAKLHRRLMEGLLLRAD